MPNDDEREPNKHRELRDDEIGHVTLQPIEAETVHARLRHGTVVTWIWHGPRELYPLPKVSKPISDATKILYLVLREKGKHNRSVSLRTPKSTLNAS